MFFDLYGGRIFVMSSIHLPKSFTKMILGVAKKNNLVDYWDFDDCEFIDDLERYAANIDNNVEQWFYRLLLLYDDIVLSDLSLEAYNIEGLVQLDNISYLDMYKQDELIGYHRLNRIAPNIDYNLSQYLKKAIRENLRRDLSNFYRVKFINYSDDDFFSNFYDMLFSSEDEKQELLEQYSYIYDSNAESFGRESNISESDFYDNMIAIIAVHLDEILMDFALFEQRDIDILNPSYDIVSLGLTPKTQDGFNKIYGTLKVECSKYVDCLPHFESIDDVLRMKNNRRKDIERFQNVFAEFEQTLRVDGTDAAVEKIAKDVKKAANELCFANYIEKVNYWTMFLPLSSSLVEAYIPSLPKLGMALTVYQCASSVFIKYLNRRNKWIHVV